MGAARTEPGGSSVPFGSSTGLDHEKVCWPLESCVTMNSVPVTDETILVRILFEMFFAH